MLSDKKPAAQALFESISDNGTQWRFVVLADDGWAITRNGKRIAVGENDRASIESGLRRFQSLAAAAGTAAACDDAVRVRLDGLETKKPMNAGRALGKRRLEQQATVSHVE